MLLAAVQLLRIKMGKPHKGSSTACVHELLLCVVFEPPQALSKQTSPQEVHSLFLLIDYFNARLISGAEWEPKMDVLESPKSFVVSLELPGVPVEGVRVELREGRCVRISRPNPIFRFGSGRNSLYRVPC